ncbi:hypothetical protein RHMOL_Rhmol09G0183000 [Rhododendron molle]|uniref:Uncharacterized protein n=1 Tax=Rhododendron molle TaxID=49168 RepID=A0ACC0MEE9_RHOML|nr:hypothetical protein RHMOL_Rhmol09G0183000 [Rhododendron molle]
MVGWEDVYKVAEAMAPLYVALILGYGSVRWWHMFTPDHCGAIDRFVCYFILPLFTFEFTATVDPFAMNYRFIAADAISKCIAVAMVGFWAKCSGSHGSWAITSFCLATLSNTLVVGAPLMKAMYGRLGVDLVVQASVVQALLWFSFLLFVLEFRHSRTEDDQFFVAEKSTIANTVEDARVLDEGKDLEGNHNSNALEVDLKTTTTRQPLSFWSLMKVVLRKLAANPNSYACFLGITWAFFSNRFHFKMPNIVEGSVLVMSRAGTGTAMFSMGLFTGMQEKIIACGAGLTVFGMCLRFVAGPAMMAAMPQSITTFIYAKQYGSQLHADVLSTGVIFGTMVSLPVLMAYYAALESLH